MGRAREGGGKSLGKGRREGEEEGEDLGRRNGGIRGVGSFNKPAPSVHQDWSCLKM